MIETLLRIQELDQEIRRIRRTLEELPARRAQIESALETAKGKVSAAEKALLAAKEGVKRTEGEIEAAKGQIAKYRADQLKIKSNDDYRALERQIAGVQGQISDLEDRALGLMEESDSAAAAAGEAKKELERAKEKVGAELSMLEDSTKGLGAEAEGLAEQRKALAAEADAGWLARYERIFAKERDAAIATVEHGTCGGCHMKLSPSQAVDARKHDKITTCDFCGRMLYAP